MAEKSSYIDHLDGWRQGHNGDFDPQSPSFGQSEGRSGWDYNVPIHKGEWLIPSLLIRLPLGPPPSEGPLCQAGKVVGVFTNLPKV